MVEVEVDRKMYRNPSKPTTTTAEKEASIEAIQETEEGEGEREETDKTETIEAEAEENTHRKKITQF